jgi:MoxR-like ATPase
LNTPAERYEALTAAGAADERRGATPFVGREQQLTALAAALGQARDERTCRLVTVTGPPGIGKSRLVREFTATLGEEATVVVGRCLSYAKGSRALVDVRSGFQGALCVLPIGSAAAPGVGRGSCNLAPLRRDPLPE